MLHRTAAVFFAALALCAAAQEWNAPNTPKAKEHPLVKFYPQSSVFEYEEQAFDSAELMVGYDKANQEPKNAAFEGRIIKYQAVHKPGTSSLEILRNYENALKQAGLVTLVSGKGKQFPNAAINPEDTVGTFRLDRGGKPAVYVQVVGHQDPDTPGSEVTIVEVKAMEQKLEASADAWFDEISKSGRVAIYGINFDTGKATLRGDSQAVLQEVRKLAAAHPEARLLIEGHTENAGNAAANQKLSEQRAAAVKAWLVANGVKDAQLSTAGLGDTRPVADNKSDEGRAKNRRVELVRR